MDSNKRFELATCLMNDVKFLALTTNRERILYVLENCMTFEQFCVQAKANIGLARQKCAKSLFTAVNYKVEADTFHKRALRVKAKNCKESEKEMRHALKSYAKAILYTPASEVDFLCKLYACKSSIHREMDEYKAALYSIEVAIQLYEEAKGYCKAEYQKVKGDCQQKLTEKVSTSEVKPYFSYIMDGRISIENSPIVGRHYVAKADIAESEQLLLERPYSMVPESETSTRCSMCYLKLDYKFYPCLYCVELVFCDRDCFRHAYDTFHRHECGLTLFLKHISSPSLHIFRMMNRIGGPLETFLTEKSLEQYSIEDYIAEPAQRVCPEWEKTSDEKRRAYKMASTLWVHNDNQGAIKNAHHTVVGIETAVLLDLTHGLRQQRPKMDFFVTFVDLVIVNFRRIIVNVFGWHEYDDSGIIADYVANAQCLVGSLINHSCQPNCTWSFEDGLIRFVANGPIRAGEEITITYGPNKQIPYEKRQERLNHYQFACKCLACYEAVLKGDNLRCLVCSGPLAIGSVLNLDPNLNGKCLLCYAPYKDLKGATKQLANLRKAIKEAYTLSPVLPNPRPTLKEVFAQVQTMASLSLPCSELNQHYIQLASLAIQTMAQKTGLTFQEKTQMAYFFNKYLVAKGFSETFKSQMMWNVHFWIKSLIECIEKFYKGKETFEGPEDDLDTTALWNCMFSFYAQQQDLLQSLQYTNQLVDSLADIALEEIRSMVNQCIATYRPKNACLKMYGNRIWLKLVPTRITFPQTGDSP